ncbi:MAG: zinc-binding metallopeptidase [Phocaeicola sp.]
MKKHILYIAAFVLVAPFLFASCSKEELSSESIIKDSLTKENELDKWIMSNYVKPYNIDFKYRMETIESDLNYYLVPAEYDKSIKTAKLLQFLCLETYDEITGDKNFIRSYFPKMIHLVGSAAYKNNGTMTLGTAEGGLKITLYYINQLRLDPVYLNEYYFRTIHHEFAHILHQTKPYSTDFDQISGSEYVTDSWNTAWENDAAALQAGFITPYASSAANEDFVELISIYITNTASEWENRITTAGTNGAAIINAKFDIAYNYMLNSWNIDLNKLRDIIQDRQNRLGELDLEKL